MNPREEGRAAYAAGKTIHSNPYPAGSTDSDEFRKGWFQANHAEPTRQVYTRKKDQRRREVLAFVAQALAKGKVLSFELIAIEFGWQTAEGAKAFLRSCEIDGLVTYNGAPRGKGLCRHLQITDAGHAMLAEADTLGIKAQEIRATVIAPSAPRLQKSGQGKRDAVSGLTSAQENVFRFVAAGCFGGFPPSHREIMKQFGWRSNAAARVHLEALDKKGYLTVFSRAARAIRITQKGRAFLEAA